MDTEAKFQVRNLWDGRIAVVALAVVAVLFSQAPPLENNRVASNEPQQFLKNEIHGRSWQDPVAAIERHRQELQRLAKSPGDPLEADTSIDKVFPEGYKSAEVLAVLMPGGPFTEDSETRRRMRTAVVTGLNAKHLVSAEPEKLHYFLWPRLPFDRVPIAYEWYLPPFAERKTKESPRQPVLVLWILESDFMTRLPISPIARLKDLKDQFSQYSTKTWRIIGPTHSDSLKVMVEEVAGADRSRPVSDETVFRMYSPFVTAPDRILLDGIEDVDRPQSVRDLLKRQGISFIRTIGDDRLLANALIDELELRGQLPVPQRSRDTAANSVDPCLPTAATPDPPMRHIAVVAERDSVYGRSVLREFSDGGRARRYCVDSFDYLRGLDGELPMGSSSGVDRSVTQATSGRPTPTSSLPVAAPSEKAAGQHQFDYLRRLANELQARDARLRSTSADGHGLRTIGILGTDVHDKLLVLQALKPVFPKAVFITTDLDTRYLHPREQPWARNLVVASSYGLTLSPEFQGGAPPFRDSYQTAVYVATMLSIEEGRLVTGDKTETTDKSFFRQDEVDKWFQAPRTFEIGRTMAFGFRSGAPMSFKGQCSYVLRDCEHLQPPGSAYFVAGTQRSVYVIFFLIILCLWAVPVSTFKNLRNKVSLWEWISPLHKRPYCVAAIAVLLLLQFGLPLLLARHWASIATWITIDGSPLLAFEGIGAWPAEAIRFIAILVGVFLVAWSRIRIAKNLQHMRDEFGYAVNAKSDPDEGSMRRLWRKYVQHANAPITMSALLVCAVLVVLVGWILVSAFGEGEPPMTRGSLSRTTHEVLKWLVLFVLSVVVIWVVVNVQSCVYSIRHFPDRYDGWPDKYLTALGTKLKVPERILISIAHLNFISRRTGPISTLVYYPFIIPSVLLISNISFFGSPHIALGSVLLAVAATSIAVFCAWKLHDEAEKARQLALRHIDEELIDSKNDDADKLRARLDRLRNQTANLSDGAFAPFWKQTMFNALLIPFAAIGSSSLLEGWLTRLAIGI